MKKYRFMTRVLLAVVGIALALLALGVVLTLWAVSYAVPFLRFETQEHTDHDQR